MSASQSSVPNVPSAIAIAENVLTRTAQVIKSLSPGTDGRLSDDLEVFIIDTSVVLRREARVDSSDVEVIIAEVPQAQGAVGGFFTESATRTFRNQEGKAYVETIITVAVAPDASGVNVNTAGIKRSLEVLCEGYVRSLEVLYAPSTGLLGS